MPWADVTELEESETSIDPESDAGDLPSQGSQGTPPLTHEDVAGWDARQWWLFVKAGAQVFMEKRGHQQRTLSILSLCSGICSESMAAKMLDIPYIVQATCDLKESAKRVAMRGISGQKPLHHFTDVFDLLNNSAGCSFHEGEACELHPGMDILISGFPCQPYSFANAKRNIAGQISITPSKV